ncbi:MAG: hypothetical protein M3Q39_16025 [Actinomycetota bacterium]|nr:hypothetical protein [Actinomycetota bacterium]
MDTKDLQPGDEVTIELTLNGESATIKGRVSDRSDRSAIHIGPMMIYRKDTLSTRTVVAFRRPLKEPQDTGALVIVHTTGVLYIRCDNGLWISSRTGSTYSWAVVCNNGDEHVEIIAESPLLEMKRLRAKVDPNPDSSSTAGTCTGPCCYFA